MDLYLVRHGIAVDQGMPGYPVDRERPLTETGIKRTKQAAKGLLQLAPDLQTIITSPYLRARQTADILAKVFRLHPQQIMTDSSLTPDGDPLITNKNLQSLQDKAPVALVGHEPHLSRLASFLISSRQDLAIHFKKAGMAKFTIPGTAMNEAAYLDWWLTPKQLRLIGKSE